MSPYELNPGAHLMAAVSTRNVKMLEDALKRPQSASDISGALQVICEYGQTHLLSKMLDFGVKPDRHALLAACWAGHVDTAKLLVESGLDISETDRDACKRYGQMELLKQIESKAV